MAKYRFNQNFHLIGADDFLKNMLNDKEILNTFEPLREIISCTGVKYKKLSSEVVNMSYFEFLKEKNIVMGDGEIKQELEEVYEGISLGNRLRKALLWEECE